MKAKMRVGLGVSLALVLAGGGLTAACGADPDPNFQGTIHLASAEEGTPWTTSPIGFEDQVVGIMDASDWEVTYPIPADATEGWVFVSAQGEEADPTGWNAKSALALTPGGILLPNVSLTNQITAGGGTPNGINAVKAAGGEYSLGIAFTKSNGVNLVPDSLYYGHITVTAGSGAWTFTELEGGQNPVGADGEATQSLTAQVTEPLVDGLLSLVAPASGTSVIANPTMVNNRSTSTGSLGSFQIQDARALSAPGWTLTTTSVAAFVSGTNTVAAANLGLSPKNVSGVAATLGAAQSAGSAVYPSLFAQQTAGTSGTTVLDADLTFVAPEGTPAGTYTSTLTMTLVSK